VEQLHLPLGYAAAYRAGGFGRHRLHIRRRSASPPIDTDGTGRGPRQMATRTRNLLRVSDREGSRCPRHETSNRTRSCSSSMKSWPARSA
jgi:hypothetical protein